MNNEDKNNDNKAQLEYDLEKWFNIIDVTKSNYSNMMKRLKKNQKNGNFILIYYSIFLIVNTLTVKYFPAYYNATLSEYFGLIISIILLVVSVINDKANYSIRIVKIEDSLNQLKNLKRNLTEKNIEQSRSSYEYITNNTETREDCDFFKTVKQLCKENGIKLFRNNSANTDFGDRKIKKIFNYISEINILSEYFKSFFWNILYLIVYIIPFIIFGCCFYF